MPQNLGDALPFDYQTDTLSNAADELAARGVSEEEQAECDAMYDRDMILCEAKKALYGGDFRAWKQCSDDAFLNYQMCRGNA